MLLAAVKLPTLRTNTTIGAWIEEASPL